MDNASIKQQLIAAMARHLPPSAANLRVLDVNGEAGAILADLRADLDTITVPGQGEQWQVEEQSVDAVVAYAYVLNDRFLAHALPVLRPGGRLIVLDTKATHVQEAIGAQLEIAGYTRILVEMATEAVPTGVLIRGERMHTTDNTLDRIQRVAGQDGDALDLDQYRGRYVHLLVKQTPNVPIWARTPGDPITWKAVALKGDEQPVLLAFSSLPKAVGFMQPAVLAGRVKDVNKVGKFKKGVAVDWPLPILLNPETSVLDDSQVTFVEVDHMTAEAADE